MTSISQSSAMHIANETLFHASGQNFFNGRRHGHRYLVTFDARVAQIGVAIEVLEVDQE